MFFLNHLILTATYAADVLPNGVNCGSGNIFSGRSSRIINGMEVEPNSWNWIASLQIYGQAFCGATIISSSYLITAAHCCDSKNMNENTRIVVGNHSFITKSDHELSTRIENFEIHPQYDNASLVKDVCVIKTKTDLQLDGKARNTVCLPDNKHHLLTDSWNDFGERKCFIAGWGRQENEKSSGVLKSAKVKVLSYSKCIKTSKWTSSQITEESQFCADGEDEKDACRGDSGGPLICLNTKNEPVLYGIVSAGHSKCGDSRYPGIYTKVANVLDFVSAVVFKNKDIDYDNETIDAKPSENPVNNIPDGINTTNFNLSATTSETKTSPPAKSTIKSIVSTEKFIRTPRPFIRPSDKTSSATHSVTNFYRFILFLYTLLAHENCINPISIIKILNNIYFIN